MEEKVKIHLNSWGPFIQGENFNFKKPVSETEPLVEILERFLGIKRDLISQDIFDRYLEVTRMDTHIALFPSNLSESNQSLYERIVNPIMLAKKYYCFEEYLSSIALCGYIAEMLAILIWEMKSAKYKKIVDAKKIIEIYTNRTFEEIDQRKRIEILKRFNFIDKEEKKFNDIKGVRKKYLHYWYINDAKNEIKEKAQECLLNVMFLFKEILKIKIINSKRIEMDGNVLKFIKKIG